MSEYPVDWAELDQLAEVAEQLPVSGFVHHTKIPFDEKRLTMRSRGSRETNDHRSRDVNDSIEDTWLVGWLFSGIKRLPVNSGQLCAGGRMMKSILSGGSLSDDLLARRLLLTYSTNAQGCCCYSKSVDKCNPSLEYFLSEVCAVTHRR